MTQEEINKISIIIEKLQSEQEFFKDIDKNKVLKTISESSLNLSDITNDELIKRIKGVMAIEAMSGLLRDWSKEEIKEFDENVKRRPLFEKRRKQ